MTYYTNNYWQFYNQVATKFHLGRAKLLWRGTVDNIPENELPIDDGYGLVDGIKLTVGETSTSRR